MRPLPLILLACLLPALAAESYPSGVRIMGYYMVPEGTPFSIQNFTHGSSPAYAVVSGGRVQAFMVPNFPFVEPRVLSGTDEIAQALRSYYSSLGYSQDAVLNFSAVHAGILSVKGNREKGEAKCRILLGTDRNPCADFDSCLRSCYSVTSFCQPVALGAGRPFVEEIMAFEENSRRISKAYAAEEAAYSAFSANVTNETAAAYLSVLQELNKAATSASQSPLFDGYSYCFAPDYSLPVITNLQLWAQTYYSESSRFYGLASEAARVQNSTLEGLARKATAAVQPKKANASGAANATALPGPETSSQYYQDGLSEPPTLDRGALMLALAALASLSAAALGAYFVAKRMKKPPRAQQGS